ncbi:MAG: S-layer homology domain-containing protein, partial [Armatimonadetes bacterium]|nr:S-layer homology domain-containing protein [Armatimonadota bacterium]
WTLTRGQMSVFMARAMADPTGEGGLAGYGPPDTPSYTDVPSDYWCYLHVEYLAARGVVLGYPDGGYAPTAQVTRDQMAVYIARALGLTSSGSTPIPGE